MLALQGFFYELLKPELVWVLIPLAAIGITAVAGVIAAVALVIKQVAFPEGGNAPATRDRHEPAHGH